MKTTSALTLPAGAKQLTRFAKPPQGRVVVQVQASAPVRVYALAASQHEAYQRGEAVSFLAQDEGAPIHLRAIVSVEWFLVLENPSSEDVSGEYSVTLISGRWG